MTPFHWTRNYDPGVPPSLAPYPERTFVDVVDAAAARGPDRPALYFKGRPVSYAELSRWSDAFAAALEDLGVRKGDRVALLLPNSPQFLVAEMGIWKAGAIVTPLNPIYNEAELRGPLADLGPEVIVTLTPFYERVKRVQPQTRLRRVIATNIKEHLPPLLRLLFTLFKEKQDGHRVRLREGDLAFRDLVASKDGTRPKAERPRPDDEALILMSGGTTGTPKGVVGSHRGIFISGYQAYHWLRPVLEEKDAVLLPLPLFHAAAGILAQGAFLIGGNPMILAPNPRDLDDLVATVRRMRPAFFAGVPTLFSALLNHPAVRSGKVDFRSIKACFSGAAALMAETKERFEALTGGRIVEAYSLTEALVALVANPALGAKKVGSVGLPAPDVEVRIVDEADGRTGRETGEVGEITLRGPQRMSGYWGNPEETARVLRDHGDGGGPWTHTGDLGYMDPDGYVFIVDRMKDLIKPGGLQVWPREVEEAIATHPAVAEVGVAGIPDAAKGEAVKAWVVPRPGATVTPEEIRAHCKERLAPFKVPSQVELRAELPKTMVGKILRRALVAEERARVRA